MADLRELLAPRFIAALKAAFGDEFAAVDPVIHRSERADYQADVAMSLAKRLGKAPRDIAKAIVDVLDVRDLCSGVEVAGAGFINLTLASQLLTRETTELARDPALGVRRAQAPETVTIDYSGPNVAKEMHVGHVRSTVIGDSIARVLEAKGHRVVRQNHLGDWGTQFGMLISSICSTSVAATAHRSPDLNGFYKQARGKFDSDEAFADRARKRVVHLQSGDAETLARWRELTDVSRHYFASVYERLSVTLRDADVRGESSYNAMLPAIVDELRDKGLLVESDGALCVFPEGFSTREGNPLPLIVRKSDVWIWLRRNRPCGDSHPHPDHACNAAALRHRRAAAAAPGDDLRGR